MNGYQCHCGWIGIQPELRRSYERDEKGGYYEVYELCPDCESDELLEANICETCADQEAEPGYDYCKTCLTEREAEEQDFRRDQIAETKLLTRQA